MSTAGGGPGDRLGLEVRGGVGSVVVHSERLRARAGVLRVVDAELASLAAQAAGLGLDPALVVSGVLDPVGAARLHAGVVRAVAGDDGLMTVAVGLAETVAALYVAAQAYDAAEASVRDVVDRVWSHTAAAALTHAGRLAVFSVGLAGGSAVVLPTVVAGLVVGGGAAAVWVAYRTVPVVAVSVVDAAGDAARGELDPGSLDDRAGAAAGTIGDALLGDAAAVGLGALEQAARHPWLTEQLLTTPVDVTTGVSVAGQVLWDRSTTVTGLPRAPDDLAGAARWLVLGASAGGVVREGRVRVRPVAQGTPVAGADGAGDLFARMAAATSSAGGPADYTPGRIRVERTVRAGGGGMGAGWAGGAGGAAWTVFVPPTQTWSTSGGSNPFDGTSNLVGFSGERADAGDAVLGVLRAAGVPPDEPVLLVGYSQGGITAAQLAADDAVRREFAITAVMTVGSPVALADLPAGVDVLSVQHEQDLVAALDGEQNPRTSSWTTVTRDVLDPVTGNADVAARLAGDPFGPHRYAPYAETTRLVDRSGDSSIQGWRAAAAPFLAGPGTTTTATEWEATRE